MSRLQQQALEFRRAILTQEETATDALRLAYLASSDAIGRELATLTARIAEARRRKERVSRAWLKRQERYLSLLAQIDAQITRFGSLAAVGVTQSQQQAAFSGVADANALLGMATGQNSFDILPTNALQELVGVMGDGSPVAEALAKLAPNATDAAKQVLFNSLAMGLGAKATARALRDALDYVVFYDAMRIARTETLRAYRESSREIYDAHSDIIGGYRWVASLSVRTCAACIALHGRIFPTSEPFGTHPNCRCTLIPEFRENDGTIPRGDEATGLESGSDWFAAQPTGTQQEILGKAKYAAYRAGAVRLEDFIHEEHSPKWGVTRREASLTEALS